MARGIIGKRKVAAVLLAVMAFATVGWAAFRLSTFPSDPSVLMLARQHLPLPAPVHAVEAVVFTEDVASELARTWTVSVDEGVEKVRCLLGHREGGTLVVTELRRPGVAGATHRRVEFFPLPCLTREFLGTLHTHPSGKCELSAADVDNFLRLRVSQVEVVLCSESRIAWADRRPEGLQQVSAVMSPWERAGSGSMGAD